MPVYRSATNSSSFLDMLVNYLTTVATTGKLVVVPLHLRDRNHPVVRVDHLLIREGIPLVAVALSVVPSGDASEDIYMHLGAYQGTGEEVGSGNFADLAKRMGQRVLDELTPSKPDTQEAAKDRELVWTIKLRYPGQAPLDRDEWTGGPFDVALIEGAFAAIVDAIVLRDKATAQAKA